MGCPYLKIIMVRYCEAFPRRVMVPYNPAKKEADTCSGEEYEKCEVYREYIKAQKKVPKE